MIQNLVGNFLDLLFPQKCYVCGQWDQPVCPGCAGTFEKLKKPYCSLCRHPVSRKIAGEAPLIICEQCRKTPRYFRALFCEYVYSGILKKLILAAKYGGQYQLVPFFSELFADSLKPHLQNIQIDYLVAIPPSRNRFRKRGFDLVSELCGSLPDIEIRPVLERVQETPPQASLPVADRLKNPLHAFRICGKVKGGRILLIDDIFTTGATLNTCARMLSKNGAADIFTATLCRGILQ